MGLQSIDSYVTLNGKEYKILCSNQGTNIGLVDRVKSRWKCSSRAAKA